MRAAVVIAVVLLIAGACWLRASRRQPVRRPPYAAFQPAPLAEIDPVPGHWTPVIHLTCESCGRYGPHEPSGDGWATCRPCGATTYTTDQE